MLTEKDFMAIAFNEAMKAYTEGEIPVGAAAFLNGNLLVSNHNQVIKLNDPTAHAEILVLKESAKTLNNFRLKGIKLYVTLEPCPMCISAVINSRIDELYFGAYSEKWGYMTRFNMDLSLWNHKIKVYAGIMADEASGLLRRFFEERRL